MKSEQGNWAKAETIKAAAPPLWPDKSGTNVEHPVALENIKDLDSSVYNFELGSWKGSKILTNESYSA